jgi:hypothetical protein
MVREQGVLLRTALIKQRHPARKPLACRPQPSRTKVKAKETQTTQGSQKAPRRAFIRIIFFQDYQVAQQVRREQYQGEFQHD